MIAALVALIGAALVVFLRGKGLFGRDAMSVRLRSAAALWLGALVGAVLAFRQPGFDMAGIGLYSFGWREAGLGLLFGVLGILSVPLYILVARRLGGAAHNAEAITTLTSAPLLQRLFLLTTAGVAEEVIFRAVAIGALVAAGVPLAIAVAISLAVFVVLHRSSWGAVHLIFVAVAGALMTAAFVLGGVWAAILAHVIIDAPMFLAGKALARRGPPAPSQIH